MNTLQSLISPSTNRKLKVLAYTVLTIPGILLIGSCHTMQKSHSEKKQTETIQLNNGAKWPVNAEMKPHIENGEELLAAYITQKEQDYQKFAADLKALKKTLILSSHIFSSLVEICDEIFLLKNGKIIKKVTQKDFSNLASELKEFTIGNRIEKLGLS
jgi:hypothetical protein